MGGFKHGQNGAVIYVIGTVELIRTLLENEIISVDYLKSPQSSR